jgi:hypothetical protein
MFRWPVSWGKQETAACWSLVEPGLARRGKGEVFGYMPHGVTKRALCSAHESTPPASLVPLFNDIAGRKLSKTAIDALIPGTNPPSVNRGPSSSPPGAALQPIGIRKVRCHDTALL